MSGESTDPIALTDRELTLLRDVAKQFPAGLEYTFMEPDERKLIHRLVRLGLVDRGKTLNRKSTRTYIVTVSGQSFLDDQDEWTSMSFPTDLEILSALRNHVVHRFDVDSRAKGYKPSEVEAFYAAKDRLVEDDARRRQGAFFTPDLWVAEAHKTLDGVLGPNWRDECLVWDPAAGTANLTRGAAFADLIISTAEKPDVQVIRDQGYNPGAEVFQYDFLNPEEPSLFFDGEVNCIPDGAVRRLQAAAKAGKRLVFLMNPPYGTANDAGAKGTSKAGIAKTTVNDAMKRAKLGACSQQLYAQFMYQCNVITEQYGFKEHTVALFSVPTFMSSGSYRKLRHWWYERYSFQDAFLFQASHFADVSGRWGISFTVWNGPGKTNSQDRVQVTLKDAPEGTFRVVPTATKSIYNSDDREASKWVREPLGRVKGVDAPLMSSGLKVKPKTGRLHPHAIASMAIKGNNLQDAGSGTWIQCGDFTGHTGKSDITPANYRRAIALYAARKLVPETWDTQKDEYLSPHAEGTAAYEQWVDDCHVYAITHASNNCTSMRDVKYKGKTWQIHNQFFWKTRKEALGALDTKATPNLYRDCKQHPSRDVFGGSTVATPDPYMAKLIPSLNLSAEAIAVLAQLDTLWTLSLPLRETYAASKPELHLTAWDAGVYQLKHLWRDLFPAGWAALQDAIKALADRLVPGVYDHGFLLR